jgi:hypothetical protein
MILKSLNNPNYQRNSREGLSGKAHPSQPPIVSANFSKTFEEALLELFEGEVVVDNSRVSPLLSDMTKRNLKKIS